MAQAPSREWLGRLLDGYIPDASAFRAFLCDKPQRNEDQWLEFKGGRELDEEKKAARTLRQYVTGFANADGGVLVLGFDEGDTEHQPRIDGVRAPGSQTVSEWAAACLRPLPIVAPRIVSLIVDGLEVLIIATSPSRSLISCVEAGEPIYYYRIGDSTPRMPQGLIHDLLVGRRTEAELRVGIHKIVVDSRSGADIGRNASLRYFTLELAIDNLGLAFSDDIRSGLVSWVPRYSGAIPPGSALMRAIEAPETPPLYVAPDAHANEWVLHCVRSSRIALPGRPPNELIQLGPFEVSFLEHLRWPVPVFFDRRSAAAGLPHGAFDRVLLRGRARVAAALYVVARGCAPWWHHITFEYDDQVTGYDETFLAKSIRIEPLFLGRPRVAFQFLE
jgi:hypothetical protein